MILITPCNYSSSYKKQKKYVKRLNHLRLRVAEFFLLSVFYVITLKHTGATLAKKRVQLLT